MPGVGYAAMGTLSGALLAVYGCQPLKASSDRASPPDAADLTTDAGGVDCGHRQPPAPPNVTSRGGKLDLVFVAAVWQNVEDGYDDAGRPLYQDIGFDLDNTCTNEGQGPSCVEPAWATASHTDGVDGIDNGLGQEAWMPGSAGVTDIDPSGPNFLVRVREYSGEPDDDQVEVSLYYSIGLSPRQDGAMGPLWDGRDRWRILSAWLVQPTDGGTPTVDEPRFVDKHAYVSGGILVSRVEKELQILYTPSLFIPCNHMILAGKLSQRADETWELQDTTLACRLAMKDVLLQVAYYPFGPNMDLPTCRAPEAYRAQEQRFCSFVDIAFDGDSPSLPCDALSLALVFQGKQALLGEVYSPPPDPLPA